MNPELLETQTEVRNAVLDAAERLFEQFGYRKTTVEEIAQEAKIGKGSVYLHFASKEDLGLCWLKRLHQHIFGDLVAITKSDQPFSKRLETVLIQRVMLRFDVFTRHRRSMDEAMTTLREIVHERREEFHCQEAKLFAELIHQGVEAGELIDETPYDTAISMVIATNSLLPYSLKPIQLGDRDTVLAKTTSLAKLLVRAVTPIERRLL